MFSQHNRSQSNLRNPYASHIHMLHLNRVCVKWARAHTFIYLFIHLFALVTVVLTDNLSFISGSQWKHDSEEVTSTACTLNSQVQKNWLNGTQYGKRKRGRYSSSLALGNSCPLCRGGILGNQLHSFRKNVSVKHQRWPVITMTSVLCLLVFAL